MSEWKPCTKDELEAHLATFPNLDRDVAGMCDPPLISWNDFSEGKIWPESMVAKAQEVWKEYGVSTGEMKYWIRG